MNVEELRNYCLSKTAAEETTPFGDDTLVIKVAGKIFAILPLEPPFSINLKCDPEKAVELRERYSAVEPGYHMNKTHWNTVNMDGDIPDSEVRSLITHSYELIVKSLPKKVRQELS